jgi:hypothetical protein
MTDQHSFEFLLRALLLLLFFIVGCNGPHQTQANPVGISAEAIKNAMAVRRVAVVRDTKGRIGLSQRLASVVLTAHQSGCERELT